MHQIRDLKRLAGPRYTLAKACGNLAPHAPIACGLDVQGLLDAAEPWQRWIEEPESGQPAWLAVRVVDREAVK